MNRINKADILNAYEWRHACKEFKADSKISQEDFEFLLHIVSLSPSSFGMQPYEVFVLQNEDLLKELHPHMWGAKKQLFSASHILMFAVKKDITRNDKYFEHIMVDVQDTPLDVRDMRRDLNEEYQKTEINMLEDHKHLSDWAAKQAYIALGNLMSSAALLGIDSCPIEGFLAEEVTKVLVKNKVFDADKYAVAAFCCLGHRLNSPAREKTRKPITELVRYI